MKSIKKSINIESLFKAKKANDTQKFEFLVTFLTHKKVLKMVKNNLYCIFLTRCHLPPSEKL